MTKLRPRYATALLTAISLSFLHSPAASQASDYEGAATGQSDAAVTAYEAFIAERGQDFEACFEELPALRDEGLGLSMQAGEAGPPAMPARIMMALDASGSMAGRAGGETKMAAAKSAAERFLNDLPGEIEIGLLAFGHTGDNSQAGRAESCQGVETIYPVGSVDPAAVAGSLASFDATGWTPLAAAIEEAGRSFAPSDNAGEQVVYVISDGEETCGGDPVAAARQLRESNVRAIVNIVGFDVSAADRAQLLAVAEAGGGRFVEVADGEALRRELAQAGRTLANEGAMARTTLNTRGGQAANSLAVQGMLSRAQLCVSGAASRETLAVAGWSREKDLAPEVRAELGEMLQERAASYRTQYDRMEAAAKQRLQDADDALQQDYDRAREEYDALD